MKLKSIGTLAAVILASALAYSQAAGPAAALPSAPGASNDPTPKLDLNARVASINMESAIFATNEGQRALDELAKKFEPKRTELQSKKDAIDALKKQQSVQGVTEERKAELQRQVDQQQKALERDAQDAQEDYNTQQNEIGQKILPKVAPVIMKYAQANNIGMIVDVSQQWPNGPVLWSAPVDITQQIVEAYNAQSGVAPPAKPTGAGGAKPLGTGTKPATPAATKPATTTPPSK